MPRRKRKSFLASLLSALVVGPAPRARRPKGFSSGPRRRSKGRRMP